MATAELNQQPDRIAPKFQSLRTPIPQTSRRRADSGIEVSDGNEHGPLYMPKFDGPLDFVDFRRIVGGDSFERQLPQSCKLKSAACRPGQLSEHSLHMTERAGRLWENYFWSQGDRGAHFPPIEVKSTVPRSKFDNIVLCTYNNLRRHGGPWLFSGYSSRHMRAPHVSGWHPPSSTPLTGVIGNVDTPYEQDYRHWRHAFIRRRSGERHASKTVRCFNSLLFDAPDRYYPLGEEAVYILYDDHCTPLKDWSGRAICDRHVRWFYAEPLVELPDSTSEELRNACEDIYNREQAREDRYLSWSFQVGERWKHNL